MSPSKREARAEAREVAAVLAQLAQGCGAMSPAEFSGIWRGLEPRVLAYLRACEAEEGLTSGSVERLRNLTWEVAVTADINSVHRAALSRLAQLFGERAGRSWPKGASVDFNALGSFGVG